MVNDITSGVIEFRDFIANDECFTALSLQQLEWDKKAVCKRGNYGQLCPGFYHYLRLGSQRCFDK